MMTQPQDLNNRQQLTNQLFQMSAQQNGQKPLMPPQMKMPN